MSLSSSTVFRSSTARRLAGAGLLLAAIAMVGAPVVEAGRGGYTSVKPTKVRKAKKKSDHSAAKATAMPAGETMSREAMMSALSGDAMMSAPGFELSSPVIARDPNVAASMMLANMSSDDPLVWRQLGTHLVRLSAFNDAIEAFSIAIDKDPSDPDSRVDLGSTLIRAGESKQAKRQLRAALKLEPFHALAYYNLGVAHQQEGEYDEGMAAFKQALKIDPNLGDPEKNPGAATNGDLPYAKLDLYRESQGRASTVFTSDMPSR